MGLFDSVRCDYPLPDPRHQRLLFQTKCLDCLLEEYTITSDGRLVRHAHFGRVGEVRDIAWPIHGDLEIHAVAPEPEGDRVEYLVRFTHGRVEWVRPLGPPPARSTEPMCRVWPPGRLPLTPGVHGRRLTADEFIAYTPEKLELVDGRIPGDEELLVLLLTGLGLRWAAALVGPEAWGRALDELERR